MKRNGIILAVFAVGLAGCAGMPADDRRTLAIADHQACESRGFRWPSNRYDDCRYDAAERRHQRDWQNLNLARMPRIDQGPERPLDAYRPLSRQLFECSERVDENGVIWVDCNPQR